MIKKLVIKLRTAIKLIIIIGISLFLIVGGLSFFFNATYSVSVGGEFVGYTKNKSQLQKRINNYIQNGDEANSNIAFVEIDKLPEYKLCLLKKDITTNDEEIFNKVKSEGITYYRYYAIAIKEEEKLYLADIDTAESVISELKEKNSSNIDNLMIIEKYETEIKDFTSKDDAVSKLYEKKVVPKVTVAKGTISSSKNMGKGNPSLRGVTLSKPTTGTISSRFGSISSVRGGRAHSGLDIAAPKGTTIVAAADGTVTCVGYKNGYGNLVVLDHGNGIQTYYGHCSVLCVSYGQKVSRGQKIALVGSTGNSTGPHLHLEVRVDGVAYNPQNYVY